MAKELITGLKAFFTLLAIAGIVLVLESSHYDGCSKRKLCDPFAVLGYSPSSVALALVLAGVVCICIALVAADRKK